MTRRRARSSATARTLLGLVTAGALAASSALAPASAAPAVDPGLEPYYGQVLTWEPCEQGRECAWLTVPRDYAEPAGPTIRLRLTRVPASGPADRRQGSLVVNPGGPGASGLDFASYVARSVAPAVAREFDIVGFDTRGVGRSAPVRCMTAEQTTRWLRADLSPDTPAEERRIMALGAKLARGCLEMSPGIARHVGTENTVRDLDIMRAALGDDRLNLLGYSYGTYLGSLYAEDFPDRVGRFVLDGAVDPSLDVMEISKGQSRGFQVAVTRFAKDCAQSSNCPWPGPYTSVISGINRLLSDIDRTPMPTGAARQLVQAEALSAIFYAMYSPALWPSLRFALNQAALGDGRGLQTIADYAADRTLPNQYETNMASAFPAIACWDGPAAPGRAALKAAAAAWSRKAPVPELARAMSWGNAACSAWFGHSTRIPAPALSTTTSPILVIGTTYDPATPYAWAQALARQLPTATLLTYDGDGHTAYGSGSRCIDDAVDRYLLTGEVPPAGTVCR